MQMGGRAEFLSVRAREHKPYTESPKSPRPKKAKSKVKSMLIIFFYIKSIVDK
jgi:hypothetical protein